MTDFERPDRGGRDASKPEFVISSNLEEFMLRFSGEVKLGLTVDSISLSTKGASSSAQNANQLMKLDPVAVNNWSTSVSEVTKETVIEFMRTKGKIAIDLAEERWFAKLLNADDNFGPNRSWSLILSVTATEIHSADATRTRTYTSNHTTYNNGTSSSGTVLAEDHVKISKNVQDSGCGASLAYNVYKDFDDVTVTLAMGVSYAFMTDEAKKLAEDLTLNGTPGYYPSDQKMIDGRMSFVNSSDIVNSAWIGVNFNF